MNSENRHDGNAVHDDPAPPEAMTYREGAYVIDTRVGRLAQVMGTMGPRVQVRRPGGGREWEVSPQALRLATREERAAAEGCAECVSLRAVQRAAVDGGEKRRAVEATVAVRRHVREVHA